MSKILSAEVVDALRDYAFPADIAPEDFEQVCDSHEALRSELAEAITLLSDIDACLGGADPFSNPEWSWQRSMNKAAADIRAFLARTAEVK